MVSRAAVVLLTAFVLAAMVGFVSDQTPVQAYNALCTAEQAGAEQVITNLVVHSQREYRLDKGLGVGDYYYTDRDDHLNCEGQNEGYRITSLPGSLQHAVWIRTPNEDSHETDDLLVEATLAVTSTVYVLYDPRATDIPFWMKQLGAVKTMDVVGVCDIDTDHLNVYRADHVPAGVLLIGGNMQAPASGAQSNYLVLVVPEELVPCWLIYFPPPPPPRP